MSPENGKHLPESDARGLNLKETELTLRMPGETRGDHIDQIGAKTSGTKRGFSQIIDLNHDRSSSDVHERDNRGCDKLENQILAVKPPAANALPNFRTQLVGWPPVRGFRKNAMKSFKFVKVAVDGAPFLRKLDLELYSSYQELLCAFDNMFSCLTICNYLNEKKLMDTANGVEYVATYEDKDGDWMLVGDVPWKMFVESCKRLRLMKSSEAIGLAPRTPQQSASTS